MFESQIERLNAVQRVDRVLKSSSIEFGDAPLLNGGRALAARAGHETFVFEERGKHQFLGHWSIPPDHFARLPRELQAAELQHFVRKDPKELTLRAVEEPNATYPAIRSIMSGRYTAFDSADVLKTIEPHLGGYEIQRQMIDRDELVIAITRNEEYDVSRRQVGDIVKAGLTIRNSEVGTMSLGVEFSTWRLKCLNGMIVPSPEITVRQRHIWISRAGFVAQLRTAVMNALNFGRVVIAQLRAAHDLLLPNLTPDAGGLQAEVVRTLKREGVWNQTFKTAVEEVLGTKEEASLFGLVQFLTGDFAKQQSEDVRLARERAAGRLLALAG